MLLLKLNPLARKVRFNYFSSLINAKNVPRRYFRISSTKFQVDKRKSNNFPYFGLRTVDEQNSSLLLSFERSTPAQFRATLNSLKSPSRNKSIEKNRWYRNCLWLLPHFAYSNRCLDEFVSVLDVWWLRLEPYVETSVAKFPSTLIHLGKLQEDFPQISIVEKIGGWKSLDQLLKRMSEIGFHRFTCRDVNSAFAGLLFLVSLPSTKQNYNNRLKPIYLDELKYFGKWLDDLKLYFCNKSSTDNDWSDLLKSDASVTLSLFRQFELAPEKDLLAQLCKFCQKGFEITNSDKDFATRWTTLTNYADALLFFNVDPDLSASGSWRSWYAAWRRTLDEFNSNGGKISTPPSVMGLSFLVEVAARFGRSKFFADIFDLWYRSLRLVLKDESSWNKEKVEVHLASLIYNTGVFAYKHGDYFLAKNIDRSMQSIRDVIELSEKALVKTDLSKVPSFIVQRVFWGIIYFNWTKEQYNLASFDGDDNAFPSKSFFQLLERRYSDENRDRQNLTNETCTEAAELLLSLKRLTRPISTSLLESLLIRIVEKLDTLEPRRIEKVLCFSGEASVVFDSIESRLDVQSSAIRERSNLSDYFKTKFWPEWFAKAESFLKRPIYSSKEEESIRMPYLLFVIINAADRARRLDDFEKVQTLWERRLREQLFREGGLKKKWRKKLFFSVVAMMKARNWRFDPELAKKLDERPV